LIERRLGVVVDSRANHITIAGSRDGCDAARRVLETLYAQAPRVTIWRRAMSRRDPRVIAQARCSNFDAKTVKSSFETINLRKRPVRARTAAQDSYIRALKRHEMVFGIGPAGTAKTWLGVAHAAQLFERKEVDRIILSRPAVEAGERAGFPALRLREKVDPYLRPIYDALYGPDGFAIVERALQAGESRSRRSPSMRGRTRQRRHYPGRSAKHHLDADEDVPDAARRKQPYDHHRRSLPGRSAERPDFGLAEAASCSMASRASPR